MAVLRGVPKPVRCAVMHDTHRKLREYVRQQIELHRDYLGSKGSGVNNVGKTGGISGRSGSESGEVYGGFEKGSEDGIFVLWIFAGF